MNKAYGLLKAERPESAAAAFEEILKTEPSNRQAELELVYIRIRLKRWKEAVVLLDTLLEDDPSDMRLRMERGYARLALGERAAAADEFALVARETGQFQAQAKEALKSLSADATPEGRAARCDALLNEGYDLLRRGEKAAARDKFRQALIEAPGRTEILKQLGYMSLADGDMVDAVKDLEGARLLAPFDYETALELGYIYDGLHDEAGAEKSFAAALPSDDPKIRAAAAASLSNIRGKKDPLYFDVYASPYDSTRFSDAIAYFEASAGYKPNPAGSFSFYLGTRYTQDSRSRSGAVPEIYSDNYASLEPGIRFQPAGFNANLTAEWGLSFNLLRSADHPDATEFDGRVVLADYHYWEGPRRLFADAGGSAGFYSRYRDNVIGYLQLRGGDKVWDDHSSQLSLYAPMNVYTDTNHDFYNNAVEIGAGLEFQPWTRVNLKLRAEYLHGTYMGISGRDPNPYGPHYDDVRLMLIYSGHFTRHPSPAEFQPTRAQEFRW